MSSQTDFDVYVETGLVSPEIIKCLDSIEKICIPCICRREMFLQRIKIAKNQRHKSSANAALVKMLVQEFKNTYPFNQSTSCYNKDCPKCIV